jgi:hypothetical protein
LIASTPWLIALNGVIDPEACPAGAAMFAGAGVEAFVGAGETSAAAAAGPGIGLSDTSAAAGGDGVVDSVVAAVGTDAVAEGPEVGAAKGGAVRCPPKTSHPITHKVNATATVAPAHIILLLPRGDASEFSG